MITILAAMSFGLAYLIGYFTPLPQDTVIMAWAVVLILAICEMLITRALK